MTRPGGMREAIKSAAPCRRAKWKHNSAQLLQNPRTDSELLQSSHRALQNPEGFNPPPPPGGPAHCAGLAHNFVLKTALFSCAVFAPIFAPLASPGDPKTERKSRNFACGFHARFEAARGTPSVTISHGFRGLFGLLFRTFFQLLLKSAKCTKTHYTHAFVRVASSENRPKVVPKRCRKTALREVTFLDAPRCV